MISRRVLVPLAVPLAALLLTACSGGGPDAAGGDGTSAAPTGEATSAATATATASPEPTAAPTGEPSPGVQLPSSCGELVGTAGILEALARPLPGEVSYLYAGPLPESGRTGRVTCGYGIGGAASPADDVTPGQDPVAGPDDDAPALEVSLIAYEDAASAAERIEVTVRAAQASGSEVAPQPVGERQGFLLRGDERDTLVLADADRTVVVAVRRGLVPEGAVRPALIGIAQAVLAANPAAQPADATEPAEPTEASEPAEPTEPAGAEPATT